MEDFRNSFANRHLRRFAELHRFFDMGRETQKLVIQTGDLRKFADAIADLAKEISFKAEQLEAKNVKTIQLEMVPTLRDGIDDLSKWIGKTTEIHTKASLTANLPPLPEKKSKGKTVDSAKAKIASKK